MMFDARRIVTAAGEDVVKVYDKTDGRQWDCGAGVVGAADDELSNVGDDAVLREVEAVEEAEAYTTAKGKRGASKGVVERVRIKDGFMIEGRRDGVVGVWSC
jgi:division protein 1